MRTQRQRLATLVLAVSLLAAIEQPACLLSDTQEGNAYAAQVRRVQHVPLSLSKDALDAQQGLDTTVDPDKSFVLASASFDESQAVFSNAENAFKFETYLSNSGTLKMLRPLNGIDGDVQVQIVEFESGVRVFRGVTYFGPGTYIKKIKLPDIDPDKAFPILQATPVNGEEPAGSNGFFMARIDPDTLKIERNEPVKIRVSNAETGESRLETQPMPAMRVAWQVVEMDNIQVESGIAKIPHFAADTNAYLLNSIQDMNRAFLVFYYTAGARTEGKQHLTSVRGSITEKDSLSFYRGSAGEENGDEVDIAWFAIQLKQGEGSVRRGTVHFEASESTKTVPILKIDINRAFPLLSFTSLSKGEEGLVSPSNLSFASEIPDSETLLIRRGSEGVNSISSDVDWQIVEFAEITIDQPASGDVWLVGKPRKIIWKHADSALAGGQGEEGVHQLNLYASLDGGIDNYPYLIARNVPASTRVFSWTIPEEIQARNPVGKEMGIKIVDLDRGEQPYFSGNFKVKGNLELLSPDGADKWIIGSAAQEIKWKYSGDIGSVSIYYDLNGGFGPEEFSEENKIAVVPMGKDGTGSYAWSVPPEIHSYKVKIKIVQATDPEVFDVSFNDFSIVPSLQILQPDTGTESWIADSFHYVQWQTSGLIKQLNLYYAHGEKGEWQLAAKNIEGGPPGKGGFRWLVPKEAIGTEVRLKLTAANDPLVTDEAPDGADHNLEVISWVRLKESGIKDEILHAGETKIIEWEYGGQIEYFNIEYSRDGGGSWTQIAYVTAADQIYHWTVPDDISAAVRLRIAHVKNPQLNDTSDTTIEIKGGLKLLMPKGGETWVRDGTEREITWAAAGNIGPVSIYYDDQSGKGGYHPHNLVAGQLDAKAGRCVLTALPDLHSSKVRLWIVQDADPLLFDKIAADLTILPALKILEPKTGDPALLGGKAMRIAWNSTGTVDAFSVFYRAEEKEWQVIRADVQGGPAGTYAYEWRVPEELLSSRIHFRVRSAAEPETSADTTAGPPFFVESWITLSGPLLDKLSYTPGQELFIHWKNSPDIRFVMLQHSLDKGLTWHDISVVKTEEGFFKWKVPMDVQGNMLVSARDINRKHLLDISPTIHALSPQAEVAASPAV